MGVEQEILDSCHVVAIVGISSDEDRPSNHVASYLQMNGYRIIPVNSQETAVLGETCYPDLLSIPDKVDVVDIFRRSESVPAIIDEAIKIDARAVWMQEGVINQAAAQKAARSGLEVVQNKCMRKEHIRIYGV
jgi:predicted CoA-binding protein